MSKEKEIGEVIKEALNGHEESYIEGAWETFTSKRKRKALIYRLSASGVAAAILLGLIIIGTLNQPLPEGLTAQKEPVKVIETPQQIVNEVPGQVTAVAESQPSSISVMGQAKISPRLCRQFNQNCSKFNQFFSQFNQHYC